MSASASKKIVHIHHGKQNYKTVMTAGRHELLADEPLDQDGMDTGPDPYDYLLMSLGACTAITLKMYADRKKWPVDDIFVEMSHAKVIPSEPHAGVSDGGFAGEFASGTSGEFASGSSGGFASGSSGETGSESSIAAKSADTSEANSGDFPGGNFGGAFGDISGRTSGRTSEGTSSGGQKHSGTQKIDRIDKEIIVKGDLDDKQMKRLLQISHKCPVNKTLQGTSIEMHARIRKF